MMVMVPLAFFCSFMKTATAQRNITQFRRCRCTHATLTNLPRLEIERSLSAHLFHQHSSPDEAKIPRFLSVLYLIENCMPFANCEAPIKNLKLSRLDCVQPTELLLPEATGYPGQCRSVSCVQRCPQLYREVPLVDAVRCINLYICVKPIDGTSEGKYIIHLNYVAVVLSLRFSNDTRIENYFLFSRKERSYSTFFFYSRLPSSYGLRLYHSCRCSRSYSRRDV